MFPRVLIRNDVCVTNLRVLHLPVRNIRWSVGEESVVHVVRAFAHLYAGTPTDPQMTFIDHVGLGAAMSNRARVIHIL